MATYAVVDERGRNYGTVSGEYSKLVMKLRYGPSYRKPVANESHVLAIYRQLVASGASWNLRETSGAGAKASSRGSWRGRRRTHQKVTRAQKRALNRKKWAARRR